MKPHRPLVLLLLAALLLAGCGDDDKDPGSGDPTGSSSPSPTATGPEPTDGVLVDEPLFRFHLPEDWAVTPLIETDSQRLLQGTPPDSDDLTNLTVSALDTVNFDDVTQLSPDVLGKWERDSDGGRALEPTDWAGQRVYHFSSDDCLAGYCEQFGLNYQDHWVVFTLDFVTPASTYDAKRPEFEHTPEEIQETIAAVEASWEWK